MTENMTADDLLQDRVERGGRLLDRVLAGRAWVEEIDLNRLQMELPSRCLLMQLFGGYGNGLIALHLFDDDTIVLHGFNLAADPSRFAGLWLQLNAAWGTYISRRRAHDITKKDLL